MKCVLSKYYLLGPLGHVEEEVCLHLHFQNEDSF